MTRRIWPWLRALAGAAIVGALVWRLGTHAFLHGLGVIDLRGVLAALAIGLATTVLSAWRWCLVARGLGLRLGLGGAVADYYRSQFLNAVLPAGVLGDVHRAVRHGRREGDVGRGVGAVVLERFAGQVAVAVAGALALPALPSVFPMPPRDVALAGAVAAAALAAGVPAAVFVVRRRRTRGGPAPRGWFAGTLDHVRRGPLARGTWPVVLVLSAVTLAGHLTLFVVAARVAGATAPTARLLPLMVLALVAMGLPLNVGGFGPREGVAALAFGAEGLSAAQGLTTSIVYGVLALVASLPGAAVLLAQACAGSRARAAVPAGAPVPRPCVSAAHAARVRGARRPRDHGSRPAVRASAGMVRPR